MYSYLFFFIFGVSLLTAIQTVKTSSSQLQNIPFKLIHTDSSTVTIDEQFRTETESK
jgi:hypothetical protein